MSFKWKCMKCNKDILVEGIDSPDEIPSSIAFFCNNCYEKAWDKSFEPEYPEMNEEHIDEFGNKFFSTEAAICVLCKEPYRYVYDKINEIYGLNKSLDEMVDYFYQSQLCIINFCNELQLKNINNDDEIQEIIKLGNFICGRDNCTTICIKDFLSSKIFCALDKDMQTINDYINIYTYSGNLSIDERIKLYNSSNEMTKKYISDDCPPYDSLYSDISLINSFFMHNNYPITGKIVNIYNNELLGINELTEKDVRNFLNIIVNKY